jgi:hypothetical protein
MSSSGSIAPGVGVGPGRGLQGSGRLTGFNRAIPARHRRHLQDNIKGISKFLLLGWLCLGEVRRN